MNDAMKEQILDSMLRGIDKDTVYHNLFIEVVEELIEDEDLQGIWIRRYSEVVKKYAIDIISKLDVLTLVDILENYTDVYFQE